MDIQQLLLICGAIAGPLFIIVFLIEGATRPGYDALRQPVSALAIGRRGWIQQGNFIVMGALVAAYAFGLHLVLRFGCPFFALFAIGLISAGVFITDVTGLATNAPRPSKRERNGILHDLFSLLVFVPLLIACFVFTRFFIAIGSPGWAIYSAVTGALFGTGFVLFARGFAGNRTLASLAGLLQRLTIATGWTWLALIAIHLLV